MCSWYTNPTCAVYLIKHPTISRSIEELKARLGLVSHIVLYGDGQTDSSQDLTLAGLSVRCFAPADDIRTCSVGVENINGQVTTINTFVSSNSLALCAAKR